VKLLDEIIDLLSDKSGSLTDALLKTKVLMHKIGHQELADWVNSELSGYADGQPVPAYRIVNSRVVGHLMVGFQIWQDQALTVQHLPEKQRKYLLTSELRQSISVLEDFAKDTSKHLTATLGPEYYAALSKPLANGVTVQAAWLQMEPTQIIHGLTEIRSRLLDFALGLQDKLGAVDETQVKEAAKKIDAAGMFHATIYGDGNVVVLGSHNTTTANVKVNKGDFESLAAWLEEKQVSAKDVDELKSAIYADPVPDAAANKFGPAVRAWMSKMLAKAVDASWQIELGVAGGLLTEALKAYYFGG
jgi:hypothetical protein